MVYYFVVFFILVGIGVLKWHYNLKNELVLPIIGFLLIFFAAFRGEFVDKDYQNYLESFSEFLGPLDYFKNIGDWFFYEPFFYLIPSFFKSIGLPYYELTVFFLYALLGVLISMINIRRMSMFPVLSIVCWFGYYFMLHELTQIRAAVASGLLMMCAYHHYYKSYGKFIFFFLLALLFHYSSLLILPILLLKPKQFNLPLNITLLVVAVLLGYLHSDIFIRPVFLINAPFIKKLTVTLQAMSEDQNSINFFNPMFLGQMAITIWLFLNHKMLYEKNQFAYLLLKIQLMSIVALCAFSSIAVIAFRVSEFYGAVSILTTPFIVYTFRQKLYGYIAVVTYSLFLLTVTVVVAKLVEPYKLVFFHG